MQANGTGYTGHGKSGGIQCHSMGDHFARYGIIMAYMPVQKVWVAMRNGVDIGISKDYALALGQGVIRATAELAKG